MPLIESLAAAASEVTSVALHLSEKASLGSEASLVSESVSIPTEQALLRVEQQLRVAGEAGKVELNTAGLLEGREAQMSQVEINSLNGSRREIIVGDLLSAEYPTSQGYTVHSECYLRAEDGRIALDPETGEARRVDFCVVKNGEVVDSIEVTSPTAPKEMQSAKEARIREAGGHFIRVDGELASYRPGLITHIRRLQ